ncbi:GvpL/GvpF family gas vesicle protein [Streptomyces omiyaensis]|uniref:GvpL/GvpF family gas vesicle protein n=1 Tax=Streptomyces omiyaensis TaxID=68247 RepID=UPI0016770B18|nr:GvpL/GvpF family gas vesicle protein [Streptomyces omiyaensis]GGY57717.1 gas vesicle protein [Streptomyces omiyaensis]
MVLYVYAITAASPSHDLDGLEGVGPGSSPPRTVTAGPVAAVVGDVSEEVRPARRDLLAHQAVQERLMAAGAVLPLRFGHLAPDEDTVREALEAGAEAYLSALERLRDCAEFHVRATQDDEEPLLRRALDEVPGVRDLDARIRAGDPDPRLPLALGELVTRQVQAWQQTTADALVRALEPFARDRVVQEPTGRDFLNLSLLVPDDRADALLETREELDRELGDGAALRFSGPLPPYSFVG